MTREEAIIEMQRMKKAHCNTHTEAQLKKDSKTIDALDMSIKALQAWDKFKQALDKRILEQGFDEDEWSVSYNELIKMMKKYGGVE